MKKKSGGGRRGRSRASNSIEVSVRVRPQLRGNQRTGGTYPVPASVRAFDYPTAVIVGSDQQSAFDAVGAPLLRRMREGYNTTLLAYGQTGSGKTYTVFGPTGSLSEASLGEGAGGAPPAWGVFPRIALDMIKSSGNLGISYRDYAISPSSPQRSFASENVTFVQ